MFNPVSTYRIQFHQDFTFTHLEEIIPYLEKLGIGTLYASPIFKATPGSMHGYDGVDPLQINPEIGTIDQLRRISKRLKEKGIGWLQDIVPNHMAFHPDNEWLMDVLEKGNQSPYYSFFDQGNATNLFKGPLMVPFLAASLNEVIDRSELKIAWQHQRFVFDDRKNAWPLSLRSYAAILSGQTNVPASITQVLDQITDETMSSSTIVNGLKMQLDAISENKATAGYFKQCIDRVNNDKARLKQLAAGQHYRLCSWEETDHTINYRRFFIVNELICLNIHQQEVFDKFHQLTGELVKEGVFQGLRVDHIDGLYDPEKYIGQLRRLVGDDTYIVVEKILQPGETMPQNWPIQGTTGYDFLAQVNNLLTGRKGEAMLNEFYQKMTGTKQDVQEQVPAKKRHILTRYMGGEWDNLTHLLIELKLLKKEDLDKASFEDLKQAVGEFLIACPVYRFYGNSLPFNADEAKAIQNIFEQIGTQKPELKKAIQLLENVWLKLPPKKDGTYHERALQFYQRCMQFTGPLMAKGVEDTLMYTNHHFIAHNEVGDSPQAAGISIKAFHEMMAARQKQWPLAMNGTATHDTKRGEDVRARLQVLPAIAEEWIQTVQLWQSINADLKQQGKPDANDEYFIYQTLIGTYPMPGDSKDNFNARLERYLEKALREGKQHSNWASPGEAYERAAKNFAIGLLDRDKPFWKSFEAIKNKVTEYGVVNSLAQVLLKFTCPGVPDVYQGSEHWDLSMVDPDNRRPVDYAWHQKLLETLPQKNDAKTVDRLWENRLNGQIKIWLTRILAAERKSQPLVFTAGDYLPLKVEGAYQEHVLAFARRYKSTWYVVALSFDVARLCAIQKKEINLLNWADTRVLLPDGVPGCFENRLLNTKGNVEREMPVQVLFKHIPLAWLYLTKIV